MPEVRIFEIYDSIQGESTLAGMPCTIVRLAGCPLRCSYCDTRQALSFGSGHPRTIEDVVEDVNQRNMPLTLVTGGEPLAQKQCLPLLAELARRRPIVQLETSGAFEIRDVPAGVRRILDIKTPGSGEEARNRWSNLDLLRDGDEIKFVLADRQDYEWAVEVIRRHSLTERSLPVLFSPVRETLGPEELAAWLVEDRLPVRLQLQVHKVIWGNEATGV